MNKPLAALLLSLSALTAPALHAEESAKPRIAVMDFSTVDIEAEKYLRVSEKKTPEFPNDTVLTPEDRASMDKESQGYIRGLEAQDKLEQRRLERERTQNENARAQDKAQQLRMALLGTRGGRAVVIGADIMATYLGQYNDSIEVLDRKRIEESINEMSFGKDSGLVAGNTAAQFGKMTGATHMVYGIVQDLDIQQKAYSGYGVKTASVKYKLNVLVRMIEIATQKTVFSGEFSAEDSQMLSENSLSVDNAIFKNLLRSALKQASESIHAKYTPASLGGNASPTPAQTPTAASGTVKLSVSPRSASKDDGKFDAHDAEIWIDGKFRSNAPATLEVIPGAHRIEVKLEKYKSRSIEMNVQGGEDFSPKLERE